MHFLERQDRSTKISYNIMESLFVAKKIKAFHKADKKTDIDGTDYLVQFSEGESFKKVQFKNREEKWKDLPITRYQPFYGVDDKQSVLGRDYRSLTEDKNEYYIVASQNLTKQYDQISITSAKKVKELLLQAEKEWFGENLAYDYFDRNYFDALMQKKVRDKKIHVASNGVEAWFKKNYKEAYGKINVYIPYKYVDKVITLL